MVYQLSKYLDSFELDLTILRTTAWSNYPQVYILEPAPRLINFNLARLSSIIEILYIMQSLIITQLISYRCNNKVNYFMRRLLKRNIETPQFSKLQNGINMLQQTIGLEEGLCGSQNCNCLVCKSKNNSHLKKNGEDYDRYSQNSQSWLLKILQGLAIKDALTLKIYIPDICFIDGDSLIVFHTDKKDYRIKRMEGILPAKGLYYIMLKLKKQYKEILQQKFQKSILKQVNPQFVHEKYLEHFLPSYFDDSEDNTRLKSNRSSFKKYVLHKDQKFLIQSIQEHKINQNQPFCVIKYKDGTSQLFSKKEFQAFTLNKLTNDIAYIQSYIKQKREQKANYTSGYSSISLNIDKKLFARAEKQILILIGGIGKYSQQYQDLETFQDSTIQLMKQDIQAYIDYMTYKIIHYLAMVSRIYVKHIKINWIRNDLGMVYVQNIFEFETTQICLRPLKYCLPPREQNIVFYKDSQNFIALYKQIQMLRQNKRLRIRQKILKEREQFPLYEKSSEVSTVEQTHPSSKLEYINTKRKQKLNLDRGSRTISTSRKKTYLDELVPKIKSRKLFQHATNPNSPQKYFSDHKNRYKSVLEKYII